jgi:hypothetical protein
MNNHTSQNYRDRAATLAVALLQIVDAAPRLGLRQAPEAYPRDELANLERQLAADRSGPDA